MSTLHLENILNQFQSEGRYFFTLNDLQSSARKEKSSIIMGLKRLKDKRRIAKIRNGFYVIVPAEYMRTGMLPAPLFLDDLMQWLNRSYYIGLLSAAAMHGAAHQQPQKMQVIVGNPHIRPVQNKGVQIQFIRKSKFPKSGLILKNTDTGTIRVSNPAMTALDLLLYQRQCGGFQRVIEVLAELTESFGPGDLEQALKNSWPTAVLQRFGFLCESFLNMPDCIDSLLARLKVRRIHPVRLSSSTAGKAGKIETRWQVILNTQSESEP